MTLIQTFHGTASNGTPLTAVYAEQPAAAALLLWCSPAAICRDSCIGVARSPHRKP